jgi:hypothetical protein
MLSAIGHLSNKRRIHGILADLPPIPKRDVVGQFADSNGVAGAFLLSKGVFTTFEAPGAGTSSGQGAWDKP